MSRKLRVAIVGAGFSNSPDGRERWAIRGHVPALRLLPGHYSIVALCTTRMETASNAARHLGVPHAFDNVERMLASLPEIDIVCVSVRPALHHAVVMAALGAGKHVYCEQPLGVATHQAEEMHALAKRQGVRTVVGHQTHYEPAALQMADLVRQGYLGRPLTFSQTEFFSNYIVPRPANRQWLFQAEMGGHPGYRSGQSLERLRAVTGKDVTEIAAMMSIRVPERANLDGGAPIRSNQVDNMSYLLRLGNEIEGTLQVSFTAWYGSGTRFELYGTEGMLMLATRNLFFAAADSVQASGPHDELVLHGARADIQKILANPSAPELLQGQFRPLPGAERYRNVIADKCGRDVLLVAETWRAFARAINEGSECSPSFADKVRIHRVWDAAEQSERNRRWVDVDYSGLA